MNVLKDINISMAPGEFLVLVGPSGCGKSTLLSCISGLTDISSGTIRIAGKDRTNDEPADRDIAHGVPVLCPVPQHERGTQHRLRP